jgi:hypothetical protein
MNKRGSFVFFSVFFLFLLISSVNAENETNFTIEEQDVEVREAYDWLYEQMNSSSWGGSVSDVALSVLALMDKYDVDDGIDRLKELESVDNWGDLKDSAFATLALYEYGENVSEEITWLIDQHQMARSSGEWFIQLDSDVFGTCKLNYEGEEYIFEINATENMLYSGICGETNWIDFENCIKNGEADINETINVNCNVGASPSILFNFENNYYIVDDDDPLTIENGCFYDLGDCDCLATGYVSWVLEEVEGASLVRPYLKSSCSEGARGNAFLYILTGDNQYVEWLKSSENQMPDGSWEGNLKTTYLSLLALKKHGRLNGDYIDAGVEFVEFFQKEDGSWNQNVEDTAFVLYTLYSSGRIRHEGDLGGGAVCGDYIVEGLEECEYNSQCNMTAGEICRGDCMCVSSNYTSTTSCNMDGVCDFGETVYNCPSDCSGVDPDPDPGITCEDDEEIDPVTGECVKVGGISWLKWIIIVLIILIGIAAIYFIYLRYFKDRKGGKGPDKGESKLPFRVTKQSIPVRRPAPQNPYAQRREGKIEKELDDSLKKARDLLRKK